MKLSIHWEFCTYHMIFDLREGPANTLTHLSPNVNNASTQTDNHKHRESVSTKKVLFAKWI